MPSSRFLTITLGAIGVSLTAAAAGHYGNAPGLTAAGFLAAVVVIFTSFVLAASGFTRASEAEAAPDAPAPEVATTFTLVEDAADEDEDLFDDDPFTIADAQRPWQPPAATAAPPQPVIAPVAGGAGTVVEDAPARPEWARPVAFHDNGLRSQRKPPAGAAGPGATRGSCSQCHADLTLSDRRPVRATCPVCGHSRVLT